MAVAAHHPRRIPFRHTVDIRDGATQARVITRPVGISMAATAALLIGVWGAIAGYIGPYFNFDPTATQVWDGNIQNGLLHLAPGGLAVLAALMLLATTAGGRGARLGGLGLPGILLVLAGAWFVIGPTAWPMFEGGPAFLTAPDAGTNLMNFAGASLAPGVALAALGGMAMKAAVARPWFDSIAPVPVHGAEAGGVEPVAPATAGPAGATTAAGSEATAAPTATERAVTPEETRRY